ncbi:hypothetical protein FACUT_12829 [Fusarium acutatum]|uniref:Uncharacterized protein n=1 Tax=Fusarium acutatum TaxID=78861 RepID=A0A8H4JCY5_9HYPO|nr:hypothetical protein FACUT_12829 [Fusarium acutatum]
MFMDENFSIRNMEEAMEEEDEGEEPYKRLKHIYLKPDCGLCNQPMDPGQWTLALIGNPTGTNHLVDTTKASVRASTARALEIPELAILAPEVLQMIKSFVPYHPLWKFSSIQNVAGSMSSSGTDMESYSLASIKSWQRGQPVICDKGELKDFVLRLTVDRDGLNRIEKLESWPEYSQIRSNACAYLFLAPFQAADSHIDFKFGRAFLKPSLRFGFGEFWDTPTPPKNGLSMFATPIIRDGAVRYRTVDLCNITGLTFFYFRGYIMGVHVHTADCPTATSTLDEISAIDPKCLMWALVLCLPPTFKNPTVLISTKLAGDSVLGPDYGYAMKEYLSGKEPTVFVYNVPHKRGHSMYGAVSDNKGDEPLAPFPRIYTMGGCPPYRGGIYSQAPVKGIVHVDVYYNEANGCVEFGLGTAQRDSGSLGHQVPSRILTGTPYVTAWDVETTYPEKPVLERLWVAAVWRTPWIMSSLKPRIQLDVVDNELVSISLSTAELLGLPQLTDLPSEVLQLIKAYSRGSAIWTYPAIKAKAEEMAMFDEIMSEDDDMQYKLSIVKKWHRGQDAELDENPPESVVFRFTLDSHGLLDIERLPDWPEYKGCRYRTHKYFFIDFAEAQGTWVYFKFGHARMILGPSWSKPFQFWDIPSPPTKGLEVLLRPRRTDATCNRTFDLRNITGITFFYYRGTLMGLHPHTLGAATAVPTVKDTLSKYEPYLVWIYIPIPHGDRIMRFGLRTWRNEHEEPTKHHTALLMTTKLGGDFSLGPSFDMEDQNFVFQGMPTVLVHNTPVKGGITLLGLAGDKPQETLPAPRFPIISLTLGQLTYGGNAITVDISLKGAVRINIFSDTFTGYLRGFLLEYENGSQRTAGQCRVGVDRVTVCHKPVSFCYRTIPGGELDDHKYYELSWTRGEGAPVMSDSTAGDWSMWFTRDCRGIRKIERIVGIPSYANWRSGSLAFALIPPDVAMRSSVDFRLGAARTHLWSVKKVMWDTASPPLGGRMSFFTPCDKPKLWDVHLRTLDLRSTRGLTFFYVGSSLQAIHSHTSRFPTALTTYARLPEHDREHVVWAHDSISPNDRLIVLGIRTSGMEDGITSPSVLIRTELAGDIVIGPQPRPVHRDLALVLTEDYTCDIIPEFFAYGLPATDDEQMLLTVAARSSEPNAESTR